MNSFSCSVAYYIDHYFNVPLDYSQPEEGNIKLFAREVRLKSADSETKPWLVFFQGGPGFESPRPNGISGWLKAALKYYRVLLLDQRGTGQSNPISAATLANITPEAQCRYLCHFRADNIIRDAEFIRNELAIEQWSTLGQSFGGFCTLSYLSMYPESLQACLITGGIPSSHRHPDEVYRATFKRTLEKNNRFFRQFPKAQKYCQDIADYLLLNEVNLPNGQRFTVEQFQQIGINFGVSGRFMPTYYLLEEAFVNADGQRALSYRFLNAMLAEQSFQTNPIYALLHESIYCQQFASNWSAQRVREQLPEFNYTKGGVFNFTGEMVFPWMFDQLAQLAPLKEAAAQLAKKQDWPMLYDQNVLECNSVPVAAVSYAEDMFVELEFSLETAAMMPMTSIWITNEYEHDGLRADGERVFTELLKRISALR